MKYNCTRFKFLIGDTFMSHFKALYWIFTTLEAYVSSFCVCKMDPKHRAYSTCWDNNMQIMDDKGISMLNTTTGTDVPRGVAQKIHI